MEQLWEGLTITGIVLFVIGIWRFAHYLKDRKEKKLKEMPVEGVSYDDIFNEYRNATPLQRKNFKSSYEALKVEWHISFWDVAETFRMGRVVEVKSFYNGKKLQYVNFKAELKKFPLLKSAKYEDKFIATGLIKNIEGKTVTLKLIEIKKDNFFVI